ncbi:hypothetical protein ARTHRO9AX_30008 [Arthrobacter sp. 9AX]|nr:hypothetical protein ARTHRO9AX_30008 [Arthrobacter sp. 9AX]
MFGTMICSPVMGPAAAPELCEPVELLPVAPQPVAIRAMPAATAATRNARIWRMVFLFSVMQFFTRWPADLACALMLGPPVTGVTLVYAEKVKFIAFTFPASHLRFHQPLRWTPVGYSSRYPAGAGAGIRNKRNPRSGST